MKSIIDLLKERNETIATMESCTGGALADSITNVEGASSVFRFGAVTYSNEYKVKMGVSESTIDCYSVYSEEVAREMSKAISLFTDSTYGVGITGKINRADPNNEGGEDNIVFISIYQQKKDFYHTRKVKVPALKRNECKDVIIRRVEEILLSILEEGK